jgi:opacity protein-like surface antigen
MKQIFLTIIAFCLPLLFCSQVLAGHSGPYIGAFFGGNALVDAKSTDIKGDSGLVFKPAIVGIAVVGWDLEPGSPAGEGRVELEYSHRSNPLDKVKFSEWSAKGGGDVTADTLLLSCIGVERDSSGWSPYFGLGAGAARIKVANLTVSGQPMGNGSDVVFAYQVQAGVDFAVSDNFSFDLGYRLFGTSSPGFTESSGLKSKMDYLSHSAVLGLRVGF